MHEDLEAAVEELFPSLRSSLEELIHVPSVSAAGYDTAEVQRSAATTAHLLRNAGFDDVRILELDGAHPAVFGQIRGPEGAPTVLLYAHHDVQPPGPADEWTTPAFEPAERNGRLYGRGSCDDKAGIVVHVGAVSAFAGRPPVTVKVFVEGEEEVGSHHLEDFLDAHRELLDCDAIVIADVNNIETGAPSLTTSLRGLVDCEVEVRTLTHATHSGLSGGPAPDALITLARLLATLHDDEGRVAVDGLVRRECGELMPEGWWRSSIGLLPDVETIGDGSVESRLWLQPSISVLAIDAPPISEAINQLVPVARAKVSLRIPPGQSPEEAMDALEKHLVEHAPWGAKVDITRGASGRAFELDTTGPAYEAFRTAFATAWGTETAHIGCGGSIPFVAAFSDRFPDASILLTGVADHVGNAHAPDESVDLADLKKAVYAEAVALRLLAG